MVSEFVIQIDGDVVAREELLNGMESVSLSGASPDGAWSLSLDFSWSRGLAESTAEGDITVARPNGDELYGTLASVRAHETPDGRLAFDLDYEIDGGSAAFSDAGGLVEGVGSLGGDTFDSQWRLRIIARHS